MFLEPSQIENGVLRQGDIISSVQILGAINFNSIHFSVNHQGKKIAWSVSSEPKFQHSMVLSHSCEIDKSNGIKLTSIILAPIRDLNKATAPDKVRELIESNILDSSTSSSYLKYFYLQPNELLPYSDGSVVDFSKSFSVNKKSYDLLVEKKCLQMKEEIADKMALKLALYFYRENTG